MWFDSPLMDYFLLSFTFVSEIFSSFSFLMLNLYGRLCRPVFPSLFPYWERAETYPRVACPGLSTDWTVLAPERFMKTLGGVASDIFIDENHALK